CASDLGGAHVPGAPPRAIRAVLLRGKAVGAHDRPPPVHAVRRRTRIPTGEADELRPAVHGEPHRRQGRFFQGQAHARHAVRGPEAIVRTGYAPIVILAVVV